MLDGLGLLGGNGDRKSYCDEAGLGEVETKDEDLEFVSFDILGLWYGFYTYHCALLLCSPSVDKGNSKFGA